MHQVENPFLVNGVLRLEIEIIACDHFTAVILLSRRNRITDLSFEASVRNKTLLRLVIHPRNVAVVGVSVWVPVEHVEEKNEVVASLEYVVAFRHSSLPVWFLKI